MSAIRRDARLGLTPRQKEIASLIANGMTTREMAEKLGISADTVRVHIRLARATWQARNRAHLAALYVWRYGDEPPRQGMATEERARLEDLERDGRELRRTNEILRKSSAE